MTDENYKISLHYSLKVNFLVTHTYSQLIVSRHYHRFQRFKIIPLRTLHLSDLTIMA